MVPAVGGKGERVKLQVRRNQAVSVTARTTNIVLIAVASGLMRIHAARAALRVFHMPTDPWRRLHLSGLIATVPVWIAWIFIVAAPSWWEI